MIFFILASSTFTASSQIDSIEKIHFNLIEKFKKQDSFLLYIKEIKSLSRAYKIHFKPWEDSIKDESKKRLKRSKKVLALLDKYNIYREPKTDQEKDSTRWYYSLSYYWRRNTSGDYQRSLDIAIKATKYVVDTILLDKNAYFIEFEIANTFARADDFARSKLYYEKCIPGFIARNEKSKLSKTYASLADAYYWERDTIKANELLLKGIELSKEINCLDCFLANHTRLRDMKLDKREFGMFLDMAEHDKELLNSNPNIGSAQIRLQELNLKMGDYYFLQGKYDKALNIYKKERGPVAKVKSNKLNREKSKQTQKIAYSHFKLKQFNKFIEESLIGIKMIAPECKGILPNDSILYAENTFLELFAPLQDYYTDQYYKTKNTKALDTAISFALKSIKVSELIDHKIVYSNSKSKFTKEVKSIVDKAINAAHLRHSIKPYFQNEFNSIRAIFNASKDQILKDKIALLDKVNSLDKIKQVKVDSLIRLIVNELNQFNRDNSKIIDYQDQIERITGIAFGTDNQNAIQGNYFEYLITSDKVYVLIRLNEALEFHVLGTKAKLTKLITELNDRMYYKNSCDTILNDITSFLFPIGVEIPSDFTIIPDGILSQLPFDILRKDNRYFIEDHTIKNQTHYLQPIHQNNSSIENIYCLNPEYYGESNLIKKDLDRSGFYPLPFAKEEISRLKSIFSNRLYIEKGNSISSINQQLKNTNIFHFTGHAKANKDSAYLVLNRQDSIIKWTYEQIYHNQFNLSLVTLSACETGLGQMQHGDGLNSMARSFLGAGSDAVVYSLWTVNDMSTAKIMKDFYTGLQSGKSKNTALRLAKINFLKTTSPDRRHPYYWGAFIAAGNMTPIEIPTEFPFSYFGLGALGFLALGLLIYKIKKY